MTIAIVGYGKMGRMIERLATERGITVALKLDEFNNVDFAGITPASFADIDVAIDFSTPSTVIGNIERIAPLGVNLVIGTTGWQGSVAVTVARPPVNDTLPNVAPPRLSDSATSGTIGMPIDGAFSPPKFRSCATV